MNPLLDLQKQRDKLALAMRIRLGKDGFQLISRRLPGNLQLPGGDIGRSSPRDDAGDLCFRWCQPECLGRMLPDNGDGFGKDSWQTRFAWIVDS